MSIKDYVIAILMAFVFEYAISHPGENGITTRAWLVFFAFWLACGLISQIVDEIIKAAQQSVHPTKGGQS